MLAYDLTTVFNSYKYICDSNFVGTENFDQVWMPQMQNSYNG
jgi:hypothetical protein